MEKKKILVVDDDKKNRYLVSYLLKKEGFEVVMATNGFEGIEAARKQQMDLIIMDIKMPKMDGYETTSHCSYFLCHGRGQKEGLKSRLYRLYRKTYQSGNIYK